ncbi:MAG: T9SS type A sorting domain-containing protein [Bacteroidetes bacterium]|nr:T9SS type A sorting domain-containing protein [Bacteroidota bacterium]MBU1719131.1 T9SS type A sorting domain-containing protein [Bacteroidota bacterium]
MKRFLFASLLLMLFLQPKAQVLTNIAAYDTQSSSTSGIYVTHDTAVFRYSWYYQEWFALSTDGLTRVNDTAKVSLIAAYNNKTSNSSGLFVFSDTAVFNYNWIIAEWLPLSNSGLPRKAGKPNINQLAVYGDSGSSSLSKLYALTDTAVFRYEWYYHEWYQLSGSGLLKVNHPPIPENDLIVSLFPNPVQSEFSLFCQFPEECGNYAELAIYDETGALISTREISIPASRELLLNESLLSQNAGIYLVEIKSGKTFRVVRMVCKK